MGDNLLCVVTVRDKSDPMNVNKNHSDNLRGSLWMMASMAGFAVEDAFVKVAAVQLPVGQVLMIFGLGGALIFAALAYRRKERFFTADVVSRAMRIRVVFEFTGRLFYVLALAMTPLSSTTAILQATPIIVVLGAAVFFGEKVGWQRWAAIIVGLLGVIVILRPSSGSFSWLSLLAVIGMIGFAGRDLASRAAPLSLSTSILGLYGFLTIVFAGACCALWEGRAPVMPDARVGACMAGAIIMGVFAYSSLMKAMRTGEVSAVTPYRYTRLLFGLSLGVILFGEKLDPPMILGCVLVVLSGLSLLLPGFRRAGLSIPE